MGDIASKRKDVGALSILLRCKAQMIAGGVGTADRLTLLYYIVIQFADHFY